MRDHFIRFRRLWPVFLMATFVALAAAPLGTQDNAKADEPQRPQVHVEKWLVLGPIEAPYPAFNDENDDEEMKEGDLLAYKHMALKALWPVPGDGVHLIGGGEAAWKEAAAPDTSGVLLSAGEGLPRVAYLAAYLRVPQWMKVGIKARATQPFELFVDGESVVKEKKGGRMDADAAKTGDAKVEMGTHLLVVKTVFVPGDSLVEWRVDVNVSAGKDFDVDPILTLDPRRRMTISDVLDGPSVRDVEVSPDGSMFLVSMSKRTPPEGTTESWVEVRRFKDGSLVRRLTDLSGVGGWQWAPTGNRLSYVARDKDKGTLKVLDLDTGDVETIVEDVEHFSDYDWSPDGTFVAYSVNEKPEENKTGVMRLRGVGDRRDYERNRSYLYLASVPAGVTRRLTAGEYTTRIHDISPDARSVVISRNYEYLEERPYSRTELVLLDLKDQTTQLLYEGEFIGGARYSPDGKKLLITGGPSAFGDAGKDVPAGVIPNDYDEQAYIFDLETKNVDAITKDFDPSVSTVYWPKGGDIYIVASEGEYSSLYEYDVGKRKFKKIDLPSDVVHSRAAAENKPALVYYGSGANRPWRLYGVDMNGGKSRTLLEPVAERFEHVEIGKVEDWNFTAANGDEIVGRIHYPPDFTPDKKWPCIVYYYGGTSPVDRSFGGRYPKNLWAANGYVVYVLQPSGATGFGQAFSTEHVNDWGKTTADEIIDGTHKFLAAHPFVDPDRVGCIGASFGGFMTQLLVTKTDIYAAAVSHAGISDITSYWGEGYWGYEYNAVSAAGSFPWNRPDIYIGQSPLFSADKVTTPLLLLHGTGDTNVPPGESEQMYAALKLLGKEVEYIRIEGQNHWILDYKKRIVWNNAIVSWFDKWLKGESQWWDDMYPPLADVNHGDEKD
jgi:dipeptidyl aminopeptidase/acylaminoacyl peptidase